MIELRNVSKSFGALQVIKDLSLSIGKGERLCVIGKSGTGKSVLMKLITGLLPSDSGEIWIEGENVTQYDQQQWNKLMHHFGVVFQGSALFDSLTVEENVGIRLFEERKLKPAQIREQVSDALEKVGLKPNEILHKYPAALSGGMRKRVGVARAIIHRPAYVFYDEPTTGLDPINSEVIDELIESLSHDPERTSILITHDMYTVKHIATRVLMIHEAELRFLGTPEELFASNDPVIQHFLKRTHF